MHKKQSKEASRHVEAVLSALDILDCFQEHPALTLKEIIDQTGLTRSRAMRLIGTLEARDYLVGNPDRRTYHPGIKLAILAKSFEKNNQVEVLIRPMLKQLANDTGESATFYVRDGIGRVALAREEGHHGIRYVIREGQRHLLHRGGASSKVLIAFGPPDWQVKLPLEEAGDAQRMAEMIETVRAQGYAVSKGENTPGAHSIAAPVFNTDRKLVGALAISGPSLRMTDEQIQKWVGLLVDAANYLSRRLTTICTMES